jgi:hypothetical protein
MSSQQKARCSASTSAEIPRCFDGDDARTEGGRRRDERIEVGSLEGAAIAFVTEVGRAKPKCRGPNVRGLNNSTHNSILPLSVIDF